MEKCFRRNKKFRLTFNLQRIDKKSSFGFVLMALLLNLNASRRSYLVHLNLAEYIIVPYIQPRTFNIERITVFVFSFCIGFVTQLNDPSLGVLKNHYITKRIGELLIGNSRFVIYNLLNQLLYWTV